jgi:hypothetical protein
MHVSLAFVEVHLNPLWKRHCSTVKIRQSALFSTLVTDTHAFI